jgi:hypothetical protein
LTLVVETGSGDPTAESYASVADANAYFSARGVSTWDGLDPAKEVALRLGTSWLDGKYAAQFKGYRASSTQALRWPRAGVNDADGYAIASTTIPTALKNACCEAALLSLTGSPLFVADTTGDGGLESEKIVIGPIEVAQSFSGGAKTTQPSYPAIEALLFGLIGSGSTVERA